MFSQRRKKQTLSDATYGTDAQIIYKKFIKSCTYFSLLYLSYNIKLSFDLYYL